MVVVGYPIVWIPDPQVDRLGALEGVAERGRRRSGDVDQERPDCLHTNTSMAKSI